VQTIFPSKIQVLILVLELDLILKPGFDSKNQTQFKFGFKQSEPKAETNHSNQPKNVTCPTLQIAFHLKRLRKKLLVYLMSQL
jgi:hypothetical protein